MDKEDNIRSITLRIAIFFGLTTFTLCIGIFYIKSIIDDKQMVLNQKDSLILVMKSDIERQLQQIQVNEAEIESLNIRLDQLNNDHDSEKE